jgi:outer membrane lipoprotein-sorting protein
MKTSRVGFLTCTAGALFSLLLLARGADQDNAAQLLGGAVERVARIVEPLTNQPPRTFTATFRILKADGLPKELVGREVGLAFQAPDHLRISGQWENQRLVACRDGQEVWVDEPGKKFGLIGSPDQPLFSGAPERKDTTPLGPMRLPLPAAQILVLPLISDLTLLPDERVQGTSCRVLKATPKAEAIRALKLPSFTLELWIRANDSMPLRLEYLDGKHLDLQVEMIRPTSNTPWPAERWKLQPANGERVETVARVHLTKFLEVATKMLGEKVPTLGPVTGERRVLAREGKGRLEEIDGTRVVFLKGTPEEMGHQQGTLLRKQIHDLVDHILYGVGVGSSFEKGTWFFGEVESAENRLTPFMDSRYLREMDALADASGVSREEVRLANFFPELFHCSGFAVFGRATEDGRMYHGRILDYLRGLGLEQNAVVMVIQPDQGNAWVNVGYAGFIGSVTAMNEKRLAIGEMGGRGQGHWDGKPMAELVREVMEKANTLDDALAIMRKGPRTCEYYYVISDAKTKRAVGIAATPNTFETIWPGQSEPRLAHAIPDAVLMSAGERYEQLARRVQAEYGKLNAERARDLMRRPVCMTSNIHCALFAPDTLDFWVANADSKNPAAHTRYTHYNLAELLQPAPGQQARNGE